MSGWVAIVPLKLGTMAKSRLSGALTAGERNSLALLMAGHVLRTLAETAQITTVVLVSPEPCDFPATEWIRDEGRGLNAELAAARNHFAGRSVLMIHGDLPTLAVQDVAALIVAAENAGHALAPDAALQGTNAIAIATSQNFTPVFGIASFARHRTLLPNAAIVQRDGLANDLDNLENLTHRNVAAILAAVR